MRKLRVFLGSCILVLCLAACGESAQPQTPKFESESEMLTYLNGIWVTENSEDKEYYIFQDGNVHNISNEDLTESFEDLMDDTLKKQGISGLVKLDYETALSTLGNEKILRHKCIVQIDPAQGTITFQQGKATEKSITVENDTVYSKYKTVDWKESLIKISDTVDFSGENFAKIFDDTKKNYTIPASKFWVAPNEYADSIKDSVITWAWTLVSKDEESAVYSLDIPNQTGIFSVNKESFLYSETLSYSTYFGTEKMSFLIQYDPYTDNKSEFSITDTTSPDPNSMIQHAAFVIQNFPGAPEFESLYNMLMNATANVSGSTMTVEKNVRGITYKLSMGTDGSWGQIFVDAPQTFKLSEIMEYYVPTDRPQEDNNSGNSGQSSGDSTSSSSSTSGNSSAGSSSSSSGTSSGNSSTNGGSASQQPTVCTHSFTQATCTTPQTCTKCGQTTGAALDHEYKDATCTERQTCIQCGNTQGWALGHAYSDATCTAPRTCSRCGSTQGTTAEHHWSAIKETIYHEEQGHYGEVQEGKRVEKYKCACGNKTDTLEEYYTHFDSVHGNSAHYLPMKDRYECVYETVYETVTKWIVDRGAYEETVIVGYKCRVCNATK